MENGKLLRKHMQNYRCQTEPILAAKVKRSHKIQVSWRLRCLSCGIFLESGQKCLHRSLLKESCFPCRHSVVPTISQHSLCLWKGKALKLELSATSPVIQAFISYLWWGSISTPARDGTDGSPYMQVEATDTRPPRETSRCLQWHSKPMSSSLPDTLENVSWS